MIEVNKTVPPPNSVQVEPAEGCTLACSFCALQAIRDNGADRATGKHGKNSAPFRFMTPQTAAFIAGQMAHLKWTSRVEFAIHGEPTANPQLGEIIAIFRHYLPKNSLMVTSNGSGFMGTPQRTIEKMEALFTAGLNTLCLDDYAHGFLHQFRAALDVLPWTTYNYPAQKEASPHSRFHGQRVIIIQDITDNKDGNHTLTNQGGCSGGPCATVAQRCAKPFRELAFRWDGNVAVCCDDWTGKYKVGNINDTNLEDLWWSQEFEAARRMLYASNRKFGPCVGCNVRTYRNGLLPGRMGEGEMQPMNREAFAVLAKAQQGAPYSLKLSRITP